jgi:spore coat protein CotH
MTYQDLLEKLSELSVEQLQQDVTIELDREEFLAATLNFSDDSNDILDTGHPYLTWFD